MANSIRANQFATACATDSAVAVAHTNAQNARIVHVRAHDRLRANPGNAAAVADARNAAAALDAFIATLDRAVRAYLAKDAEIG